MRWNHYFCSLIIVVYSSERLRISFSLENSKVECGLNAWKQSGCYRCWGVSSIMNVEVLSAVILSSSVCFRFLFISRNQTLRDRGAVCFWNPSCHSSSRRHCHDASTAPPVLPGQWSSCADVSVERRYSVIWFRSTQWSQFTSVSSNYASN